jgi:hypothetical protein
MLRTGCVRPPRLTVDNAKIVDIRSAASVMCRTSAPSALSSAPARLRIVNVAVDKLSQKNSVRNLGRKR